MSCACEEAEEEKNHDQSQEEAEHTQFYHFFQWNDSRQRVLVTGSCQKLIL